MRPQAEIGLAREACSFVLNISKSEATPVVFQALKYILNCYSPPKPKDYEFKTILVKLYRKLCYN